MNHDQTWPLLDLYLDEELDAGRRRAVAEHTAGCARCSDYVGEQSHARRAVRAQLSEVPTPAGLVERIRATVERAERTRTAGAQRRPNPRALLFPALAMLALVVVAAWWIARATDDQPSPKLDLVGELAITHATFAHDDTLLEVTGEPGTIAVWFTGKVPFPITVPEVPGYEFEGARLVTIDGRAAAQVVYEDEEAQQYVSLITFEAPTRTLAGLTSSDTLASGAKDGIAVVIWSEGDLRHALVVDSSPTEALVLGAKVSGRQ
jgi:anti-sigma factor RsiW